MIYQRHLLTVVVILATASCGGTGNVRPEDNREQISHIELDQNTDPRIVARSQSRNIGAIRPSGTNVFVNGDRLERTSLLNNYTYVNTGQSSAARIDIFDTRGDCEIEISEFVRGRMYGDTDQCSHEVRTEHSFSNAPPGNTEYHIGVYGKATVITVVTGSLTVWPLSNPTETISIQSGSEATVTRNSVEQVMQLSEREISQRTSWRELYEFGASAESRRGMGLVGKAIIGIGAAIIAKELYDRSRDDDDVPNPPPDGGDNSTRPPIN